MKTIIILPITFFGKLKWKFLKYFHKIFYKKEIVILNKIEMPTYEQKEFRIQPCDIDRLSLIDRDRYKNKNKG